MSVIHIAEAQGSQQSYEAHEAHRLWNEGVIPRDALYWQEGMTEWRPAVDFFNSVPVPPAAAAVPPTIPNQVPRGLVKDPTRLTRFLIGMLWAYLVVVSLSAVFTVISLATGQAGLPEKEELSLHDLAGLLVGLPQTLIVIVTGIIFLMWIHRANRNARGLGAEGMTFTPGWSVGWYFIPIANLWKPYQAMKQIWQASADPAAWQSQKPPALLSNWWALWIFSNVLSNLSFRMTFRAHSNSEMLAGEIITLISDLVDIPLCLIAMRLVREIIRLQNQWAGQGVQSTCGICRQPEAPSDMVFLNSTWVCARCKPVLIQQMQEGVPGP